MVPDDEESPDFFFTLAAPELLPVEGLVVLMTRFLPLVEMPLLPVDLVEVPDVDRFRTVPVSPLLRVLVTWYSAFDFRVDVVFR